VEDNAMAHSSNPPLFKCCLVTRMLTWSQLGAMLHFQVNGYVESHSSAILQMFSTSQCTIFSEHLTCF
jgi:hypothetical protein